MAIRRYSDPFQEALTLHDAMNQLFSQSFVRPGWFANTPQAWAVPVDVFETQQGYQVHALLPGVQPEDIELTVQQNVNDMLLTYSHLLIQQYGWWSTDFP